MGRSRGGDGEGDGRGGMGRGEGDGGNGTGRGEGDGGEVGGGGEEVGGGGWWGCGRLNISLNSPGDILDSGSEPVRRLSLFHLKALLDVVVGKTGHRCCWGRSRWFSCGEAREGKLCRGHVRAACNPSRCHNPIRKLRESFAWSGSRRLSRWRILGIAKERSASDDR